METRREERERDRAGVYVHVALCRSKCIYCDFFSRVITAGFNWQRYLDALVSEFKSRSHALQGKSEITLYFGGGTPSLIPEPLFAAFVGDFISEIRNVCGKDAIISELTMEVNPDDVTPQRAAVWKEAGINRLSMGIQSLNDLELHLIGRRHDASTAINAYNILRENFDNISLDLMFGLPQQSLESLDNTLTQFIGMRPEHISAYSLMYEERTTLTRLRDSGRIAEADENLSVEMFSLIGKRLEETGYLRYEISNYSLPGFESRHNSSYWAGIPYIGIGPSAHSYDGNALRSWNPADISAYTDAVESGHIQRESEILTLDELREERIMTGLRTTRGIDLEAFAEDFGDEARDTLLSNAERGIRQGSLLAESGYLRLSDRGMMISDDIIVSLF